MKSKLCTKYLEYLCCAAVALLLGEAEDVRVSEDLLEEGQLAVRVLPVPVEQVHREQALEAGELNQDIRLRWDFHSFTS